MYLSCNNAKLINSKLTLGLRLFDNHNYFIYKIGEKYSKTCDKVKDSINKYNNNNNVNTTTIILN